MAGITAGMIGPPVTRVHLPSNYKQNFQILYNIGGRSNREFAVYMA